MRTKIDILLIVMLVVVGAIYVTNTTGIIDTLKGRVETISQLVIDKDLENEETRLRNIELEDELAISNKLLEDMTSTSTGTIWSEFRLTSYYTDDSTGSGKCTGSGLCTSNFSVNSKGWYTYKGMLVLAGATNECLNSHSGACNEWNTKLDDREYFSYYDTVDIIIDNIQYKGIILDSCGASMYVEDERLDLFVSGDTYKIDRGYKGVNPILKANN